MVGSYSGLNSLLSRAVKTGTEVPRPYNDALAIATNRYVNTDGCSRLERVDGVAQGDFSGDEIERPENDDGENRERDGSAPRAAGMVRCFVHAMNLRRVFLSAW